MTGGSDSDGCAATDHLSAGEGVRSAGHIPSAQRPAGKDGDPAGKRGNPFEIAQVAARFGLDPAAAQAKAVALHAEWFAGTLDPALDPGRPPPPRETIVAELGGHNLGCWCKPGTPCHADLLIRLANP